MRHDQIHDSNSYARVDIAAVWPAGTSVAAAPLPEAEDLAEVRADFAPTPAVPDVPGAVGGLIVASYVSLLGALALVTAGSAQSLFAILICALFLAAFFTVPRLFLAVEPKAGRRPSFSRFMNEGLAIATGRSTGRDALIQMIIVPVVLTFGMILIGIGSRF